jgi:ADP-ribose pyrophosphatase YjhB (NUDIX family)
MKADKAIAIQSRDYWFKIVDFLQQNWALIELASNRVGCTILFFGDTSGVFDKLEFTSVEEAEAELSKNGFSRFAENKNAQGFIAVPMPPFYESTHPNGNIYSSGRFWDSSSLSCRKPKATKRQRATVIVEVDGAILLVETRKGLVLLPGGGLNRGELSIAAAARELNEETGLAATTLVSLFDYESETTSHNVFYAVAHGAPVAGDDAVKLFYLNDAASSSELNMSPATRTILDKFEKRDRIKVSTLSAMLTKK